MIAALNIDKLRLDMGDYVLSVAALHARAGALEILRGVDFDVKRGSFMALVGPKGAGKSVTLSCIAGALRPVRGRIRYFGYEIKGRGEERVVRMGVTRTHQQAQPFAGMTVLETATIGALLRRPTPAKARAHAREILALAGLAQHAEVRVEALALVDGRKLDIARALATDPQLLLLDDPCGGLDEAGVAGLVALLATVRARGTTIVAATRATNEFTSLADSIVEIDRGKTARMGADAATDFRF